ncbi:MAG: hypothetical protein Q8Q40_04375 [Methylococcaceae bacterium]|nr:hypothetical protein [Methylococcaceae bacterium]MDP3903192.1 hypothetical protein [Methylococcaceae bacterium]
MKQIIFLSLLLLSASAYAEESKDEWQNTTLSEETMKKIQEARYQYKRCVGDEMQKPEYQTKESRVSTEAIIKHCEPGLAKMREIYIAEKVPEVIADRHLKQMRIQTTRTALQGMMFSEAARKSSQQ